MLLRTLTAVVGLAVLAAGLWGGLPWVFLITLTAAVLGIREFYRLHPPLLRPPQEERAVPEDAPPYIPPDGSLLPTQGEPVEPCPPIPHETTEEQAAPADAPLSLPAHGDPEPTHAEPVHAHGEPVEPPLPFLLGLVWVTAFVIGGAGANSAQHFWAISLVLFLVGAFVAVLWLIAFYQGPRWPVATSYLLGGPIYVGFLLAHVMLLAQVGENLFYANPTAFDFFSFPDDSYALGRNWLIFALLTTFATDTGAYLVGRAIGRHPMAPGISPNKTWEGAVGGFIGAVIAALLLERLLNLGLGHQGWGSQWSDIWTQAWNWQPLLIGATVGIVSQAGDLLESRLKRLSGVKDSGVLMPGHGGLLDRLDSLLVTIPVVYYLLVAVTRP